MGTVERGKLVRRFIARYFLREIVVAVVVITLTHRHDQVRGVGVLAAQLPTYFRVLFYLLVPWAGGWVGMQFVAFGDSRWLLRCCCRQ